MKILKSTLQHRNPKNESFIEYIIHLKKRKINHKKRVRPLLYFLTPVKYILNLEERHIFNFQLMRLAH